MRSTTPGRMMLIRSPRSGRDLLHPVSFLVGGGRSLLAPGNKSRGGWHAEVCVSPTTTLAFFWWVLAGVVSGCSYVGVL